MMTTFSLVPGKVTYRKWSNKGSWGVGVGELNRYEALNWLMHLFHFNRNNVNNKNKAHCVLVELDRKQSLWVGD